jgi:hypothetical protein
MGITPSLKAVEKTKQDNDLEKIDTARDVLDDIMKNPSIKYQYECQYKLLDYALKCSVSKDSFWKQLERIHFMTGIGSYDGIEDKTLREYCANRLKNLDAKEIIDYLLPESNKNPSNELMGHDIYQLAKSIIPLVLGKGNKELADYFYEKTNKNMSQEIENDQKMISREWKLGFLKVNKFKAALIAYATEYRGADTIIQDLMGAPYNINQEEMDGALWIYANRFPWSSHGCEYIFNFFSNPNIKPSLEIVKEVEAHCKKRHLPNDPFIEIEHLFMEFLGLFIALRENQDTLREKQDNFDFNAAFKKLTANMDRYPALGKVLDLIHNDYLTGKITINKTAYPDTSAFEDYKVTRLSNGDNPAINRAVTNKVNVDGATPTGLIAPQLAKDLALQIRDARTNLNSKDVMGVIMQYTDPSAQHLSKMSDGGTKWIEERDKLMAEKKEEKIKKQMDAETNDNTDEQIATVAPNQNNNAVQIDTQKPDNSAEDSKNNGAVQINTRKPGEEQIDTMTEPAEQVNEMHIHTAQKQVDQLKEKEGGLSSKRPSYTIEK